MIFNVSQLLREPIGSIRACDIADTLSVEVDDDLPVERSVRVSGPVELLRTRDGVLVRAPLDAELEDSCSRCLRDYTAPQELMIEEEYLPTVDPVTGAHLPPPAEPTAFLIDHAHHLDLTEAVRQAVVLERPMQPLCRPDCRGLCPICGADLNETTCTCDDSLIDARWAKLRDVEAS